ncbi:PhzF family phenazine biosynthesis protein [Emticicia agri]|uniref:PhzF family phenazine biosynthesis protein n=1 Tax=Emticicia agri TaxID=2492393 RepID=A0A4Q5M1K6_9BACT|nr:PhzF family phenazine biosynthesis protein [Emticicia agri]RYU96098.1 PhzF family phenazine biosynthesis protein [Emticicia agri]
MQLSIYQIDAFTNNLFGGNPAAVVPLREWLSDALMQKIALENNLSETAFFVPKPDGFHIRWFTPTVEVALCGHATLAAAYVVFNLLKYPSDTISFDSKSGILKVKKYDKLLELDFPVQNVSLTDPPDELVEGIGKKPLEVYQAGEDYLLVYDSQNDIENISPDFGVLKKVEMRGAIVTSKARSKKLDFVCRFFAPAAGIDEDPVTGSAFTKLAPLWAEKLGKNKFDAEQISARKGSVHCELLGNRVLIAGQGKVYMKGKITV